MHFQFGHRGHYPSEPLCVPLLRLFGQTSGLGERLRFTVPCNDRTKVVHIERSVLGVDLFLDELRLGSASVEVGDCE